MIEHVVVDGRVFATEAGDRGMGRYVAHLTSLLVAAGYRVSLLLAASSSRLSVRGVVTRQLPERGEWLGQTAALNRLLEEINAELYVDATPFLGPLRYDICVCPVLAVLYDLIPMRFLNDYIAPTDEWSLEWYVNGLARVRKADHVIAISNVVKEHALRYLGIPRTRVDVVPPSVRAEYESPADVENVSSGDVVGKSGNIVCIQGAHRSKNFPIAIRFLEDLSAATCVAVDMIVPTPSQSSLIEGVRRDGVGEVRVYDSISEEAKLALQRNARIIAHLSLEEGYGIPLAEALSLDRPIICIDNAINRELLCGKDALGAGVLMLDDPSLTSASALEAAARFVESADALEFSTVRAEIADALAATRAQGAEDLARAVAAAVRGFRDWHASAGVAIVSPTDFGSCGVADYCHALMRDSNPRYAILLGRATRALQLLPHLRLLPFDAVDQVRRRSPGILFNLSASKELVRTFEEIALRSGVGDVLVVHDSGSHLPRLLLDAAHGERSPELERCLRDESPEVRGLADAWLRESAGDWAESEAMLAVIDRRYRSDWLRQFRGVMISHDAAFAGPGLGISSNTQTTLAADSVILTRTHYAPMPIDSRGTAGVARLADALRWSLGLTRQDLVVCWAGTIRDDRRLVTVARAASRLHVDRSATGQRGGLALLLGGAVLDDDVLEAARYEFDARGIAARFVQRNEPDEIRRDAMLAASDVVVAFCERHCAEFACVYARALSMGRALITNGVARFGDADAAIVCRDEALEDDLYERLTELLRSTHLRDRQAARSLSQYRERHTVERFFERVRDLNANTAAV